MGLEKQNKRPIMVKKLNQIWDVQRRMKSAAFTGETRKKVNRFQMETIWLDGPGSIWEEMKPVLIILTR